MEKRRAKIWLLQKRSCGDFGRLQIKSGDSLEVTEQELWCFWRLQKKSCGDFGGYRKRALAVWRSQNESCRDLEVARKRIVPVENSCEICNQ